MSEDVLQQSQAAVDQAAAQIEVQQAQIRQAQSQLQKEARGQDHVIAAHPVKRADVIQLPPTPSPAEAGPSVAHRPAVGTKRTNGGGHHVTWIFLHWVDTISADD